MKISAVIPAYDEKGNAEVLAKRLYKIFKKVDVPFEIIFIVQGTDGTFEALQKLPKNYKIKLFYFKQPLGITRPFKIGFDNVAKNCTHILTMDADLNHQPEEIPLFINAMNKNNVDIVIGSRFIKGGSIKGMSLLKKMLSKVGDIGVSLFFGLPVKDKTSGYRLCKREVVDKVKSQLRSKNFEYYPEFLIKANKEKFSMMEVPITFIARASGKSKLKLVKNLFGYLWLLKERFRG